MSDQDEPLVPKFWYRFYPELRYFKSREELREAKAALRKQGLTRQRSWYALLIVAVTAFGLLTATVRWTVWFSLPWWLVSIISMVCWSFLGAFVSLFYWHRPYIRFLRQYLQDHGIAICLKCGYDLRGQSEPRCPECGQAFDANLLQQDA